MAIPLIGPDGKRYVLTDPAEIEQALAAGYRQETAEAPQTLGEEVKGAATEGLQRAGAALEGAVRGVAPGLTGAVMGGEKREMESPEDFKRRQFEAQEMERRRQEFPIEAGVGEFVGILKSPAQAAGRAVRGAIGATSVPGRLAAGAAAEGAEGVLFGAGNAVDESALGNTELTAEKLIAGAGLGALLGAAGGGVGGVLDEAVAAAIPRVARLAGNRALEDIAGDAAIRASRAQQGVLNKMRPEQVQAAGRVLLDRGHVKGSPQAMLESLQKDIAQVGKAKGSYLDAADDAMVAPNFREALERVDAFAAKLSPLEREAVAPNLAKARKALERVSGLEFDRGERAWRAFDKWKQDLQTMAKFSRGAAEDDLALGLRRQLAGVAREELDRQLVPALGAKGQEFLSTKALYASLKDAERLAASGAGRVKPSGLGFGLYDLLSGGAGAAALAHPVGLGLAVANKFMREQGPALIARAADGIAKSPTLKLAAASFAQRLPQVAPRLGEYAAPLAQAVAKSPAVGLATHVVMAQTNPDYAARAQQAGFTPETPEQAGYAAGKAQGLVGVAAALKDTDDAIDRGIEKVMKGAGKARSPDTTSTQDFGSKRMRRQGPAGHKKRMDEVAELAANPQALLERVSANIGDMGTVAPGLSAASTALAHRAVAYLSSQIQKPPKPGPLAQDWRFNDTELFVFSKKLEAVEQPLSVLDHAAAGTLTKDQMEAVAAVYPTVAVQIRDRALERLTTAKPGAVPYKARMMLGLLTGVDPDGTLGQAVSLNQAAIAAQSQKPSEALGSSSPKDSLTLAKQSATPEQRREMRDEQ